MSSRQAMAVPQYVRWFDEQMSVYGWTFSEQLAAGASSIDTPSLAIITGFPTDCGRRDRRRCARPKRETHIASASNRRKYSATVDEPRWPCLTSVTSGRPRVLTSMTLPRTSTLTRWPPRSTLRYRRVIRVDLRGSHHVPANELHKWPEQCTALAEPVRECRTAKLDAVACLDHRLSIRWKVVRWSGGHRTWRPEHARATPDGACRDRLAGWAQPPAQCSRKGHRLS